MILCRAIHRKLDEILAGVRAVLSVTETLRTQGVTMSKELDDLTAEVALDTDVITSAVTLIEGIEAQLAAAGTDPAKLTALKTSLATSRQALADAVAAGTPAAPPTP